MLVAGQCAVAVLAATEKRGVHREKTLGSTTETGRMKLGRIAFGMGKGKQGKGRKGRQDRKSDTGRESLEQ